MLTYLVRGTDGYDGKPRTLYVETDTIPQAVRFALNRGIVNPNAEPVDPGQLPPNQTILKALPPEEPTLKDLPPGFSIAVDRSRTLFDRHPIITIALGVTLGAVFTSILGALFTLVWALFLKSSGN